MGSSRSIGLKVCLVAALPFVLSATYMSYRSLWFRFAAAQAQGTMVEITSGGAPSLVVEYPARGEQLFTTRSAGSDFYRDIAVRDKITVYYDPDDPFDARLALFVENWVLPLAAGFPGIILLLAAFIARFE